MRATHKVPAMVNRDYAKSRITWTYSDGVKDVVDYDSAGIYISWKRYDAEGKIIKIMNRHPEGISAVNYEYGRFE